MMTMWDIIGLIALVYVAITIIYGAFRDGDRGEPIFVTVFWPITMVKLLIESLAYVIKH